MLQPFFFFRLIQLRSKFYKSLFWLLLSIFPFTAAKALGQSASISVAIAFDAASVRPSKPGSPQRSNVPLDLGNVYGAISTSDSRTAGGGYLVATHQPLWRYLSFAYGLSGTQELALRFNLYSGVPKSGAPFWVTGSFDSAPEYFDISARSPAETSIEQMRLMMQSLLAERFHLVVHFVTANAPVFALMLAKPGTIGLKLQPHPSSDSCDALSGEAAPQGLAEPAAIGELPPVCGVIAHVPASTPGQHYGGRAVSLALLATSIPTMTGLAAMPRPVVDQTGLTGLYDFTLTWVHDNAAEDGAVADNTANIRDALRLQLGLQLKPSTAPINFLLIDHVERPSEN